MEKRGGSHIVKVTGMSEAMLELLDARVKQQQATGRAEYIRELIRRDALTAAGGAAERGAARHKARRRSSTSPQAALERKRLAEYHALVDLELAGRLSSGEQARLHELEAVLDRAEEKLPETQRMLAGIKDAADKLDALLAAVQALPQAKT